jgi:hypothetical protein
VPVAAGKGGAVQFDGIDDSVAVPNHASLALTAAMTIEAWVNPSVMDGWETVVLKEGAEARTCCNLLLSYALYAHDGAAGPNGYIGTSGGDQGIHTTPAIGTGVWTHLATTYDGANLRFYVNGVLVATRPQTGPIDPGTGGVLRVGGNLSFAGEYFEGLIDEVKVYNRALSAAEIQTDMGTTPPNVP